MRFFSPEILCLIILIAFVMRPSNCKRSIWWIMIDRLGKCYEMLAKKPVERKNDYTWSIPGIFFFLSLFSQKLQLSMIRDRTFNSLWIHRSITSLANESLSLFFYSRFYRRNKKCCREKKLLNLLLFSYCAISFALIPQVSESPIRQWNAHNDKTHLR